MNAGGGLLKRKRQYAEPKSSAGHTRGAEERFGSHRAVFKASGQADGFAEWRLRLYFVFFHRSSPWGARRFWASMTLAALCVLVLCLETLVELRRGELEVSAATWTAIDGVLTALLAAQLYLWALAGPVAAQRDGRDIWREVGTWVDCAAIVPFFAEMVAVEGLGFEASGCAYLSGKSRFLVGVRLMRVLRIARLRELDGAKVIADALRRSWAAMMVPLFLLFNLFMLFGALIFFLEQGHRTLVDSATLQPLTAAQLAAMGGCDAPGYFFDAAGEQQLEPSPLISGGEGQANCAAAANATAGVEWVFLSEDLEPSQFTDVANSGYAIMVTMTAVGYGDQVPKTTLGKLVCSAAMVVGLCLIAMPLTIMGHEFTQSYLEASRTGNQSKVTVVGSRGDKLHLADVQAQAKFYLAAREGTVGDDIGELQRLFHTMVLDTVDTDTRLASVQLTWSCGGTGSGGLFVLKQLRAAREQAFKFLVNHAVFCKLLDPYVATRAKAKLEQGSPALRTAWVSPGFLKLRETVMHHPDMDFCNRLADAFLRRERKDEAFLLLVPAASRASSLFAKFITAMTCLSIMQATAESLPEIDVDRHRQPGLLYLEVYFTVVFVGELVLRKWVRWEYPSWMVHLDLISAAPLFLEGLAIAFGAPENVQVWLLQLRFFRISKLFRLPQARSSVLGETLRLCKSALTVPLFFLLISTLVFGAVLYTFERGEYDCETGVFTDVNGNESGFIDIGRAAWVSLVTMTTVGYGDYNPLSTLGKTSNILIMTFGVLYLAMPLSIVGRSFAKSWERHQLREHGAGVLTIRLGARERSIYKRFHAVGDDMVQVVRRLEALGTVAGRGAPVDKLIVVRMQLARVQAAIIKTHAVMHCIMQGTGPPMRKAAAAARIQALWRARAARRKAGLGDTMDQTATRARKTMVAVKGAVVLSGGAGSGSGPGSGPGPGPGSASAKVVPGAAPPVVVEDVAEAADTVGPIPGAGDGPADSLGDGKEAELDDIAMPLEARKTIDNASKEDVAALVAAHRLVQKFYVTGVVPDADERRRTLLG